MISNKKVIRFDSMYIMFVCIYTCYPQALLRYSDSDKECDCCMSYEVVETVRIR